MASNPPIRKIARDKLQAIFRTPEMVKLFEDVLYNVGTTLPGMSDEVQEALDAHIADAEDAHAASAIGNVPAGSLSATNVQAAINELDAEKQPIDATLTALAGISTAADTLPYFSGEDAAAVTALTAFARTLLDDADGDAALATLGVVAAVIAFLKTPTSANLATAVSDETGSGALVFAVSPTLTSAHLLGHLLVSQGAPTTKAAAATLTGAELMTKIIDYTGVAANLTLPTAADLDAAILAGTVPADVAFDFTILNRGAGTATVLTAAGMTLLGTMTVASGSSATFRARKTAASAFTVYRIA